MSYMGGRGARSRLARAGDYALTLLLFGMLIAVVVRLQGIETLSPAGVPFVIDGDSLTLSGGKIRLRGIDAPELGQVCAGAKGSYQCGREARLRLLALIGARTVVCEGWERDKYQRLLGRCRAGGTELNREMVRTGWAVSYGDFRSEEAQARKAALGIWAGAFDRPQEWRKNKDAPMEAPHDWWQMLRSLMFQAISDL
jgi:endonuclease YncB( thermonuclease family)